MGFVSFCFKYVGRLSFMCFVRLVSVLVMEMSIFKLMRRTETSIIEMDSIAAYGNTVVSSTECGDMG